MEVTTVADQKKKQNSQNMREEYGYGYELSPDDFDVIGQNDAAKKQKQQAEKEQRKKNEKQ